ncbi:MAG TPA: 1-acyl-sn-glycerol-3-phosphate acyltransferase, partial [Nocardioides sp.]
MLWAVRRAVVAPAVVVLTALVWVTLPAWLIVAALVSPVLPGRWRALRLLWIVILYATCEALLLLVLWGLWFSSGLGRRVRT